MCRDALEALYGLEPDQLDLVVEHVHQEVEGKRCQLWAADGETGEGLHGGRAHARELVLQAVDEGAARPKAHQGDCIGFQLLLGRVVSPFLA